MTASGYAEAEKRIDAACRSGAAELDLRHLNAGAVPGSIARLRWLKELDLAGNGLTTLPGCMAELRALDALNVAKNSLSALPPWLETIEGLRTLDMAYNQCHTVPEVIAGLRNLHVLNLSYNPIRRLPAEMVQLESLRALSLQGMSALEDPPPAILARGLPAIRDYLRQLRGRGGAPPAPRLRVFLCHSSNDKAAVRRLRAELSNAWIDPWLDEEKLLPGQKWTVEIPKAVRASDVVIVCLSAGSVNKAGYLQKEIRIALDVAEEKPEGTIFIIPVRLEACPVPDRLSEYHWVDLFEAAGMGRLMEALKAARS